MSGNKYFIYDADGNPISKHDYIKNLTVLNVSIDNGTAELYTTNDVLNSIAENQKLTP